MLYHYLLQTSVLREKSDGAVECLYWRAEGIRINYCIGKLLKLLYTFPYLL
jgi:hypothetical protein